MSSPLSGGGWAIGAWACFVEDALGLAKLVRRVESYRIRDQRRSVYCRLRQSLWAVVVQVINERDLLKERAVSEYLDSLGSVPGG